ncbi:putative Dynein binding protein [Spironucleus salmonicida]|uniref:Outer dynein arm-docking complex subunit 4 n=1 Tax=Spironucleus salmonicida TaxID=348837 RepID=V6LDJ5_9EUKA|nr:putative Dynein binding protein [Spironucleus salmonicida]|eukprot:EST42313.1 hypothetical protein SS50377_18182 [Spironucleus salmonicida]
MTSSDAGNAEELSRLYIAEGDTCYRKQLYEKAVNAYSKSLYYSVDRNVLLNRSRCLVSLGRTEEAIKDATDAIGKDDTFYSGFYQKAESFYTGGQFENALAFYYKAYQRRPDVKKFQLGVQKAEEAILKAVDTCVDFDPNLHQTPQNPNFDTTEIKALILTDFNSKNQNRCLCGCLGCQNSSCRDMYFATKQCACRCQACLQHLCHRQGVIAEPKSGVLVQLDDCLGTNSVNATATPNTAYYAAPVEKITPQIKKKIRHKNPLELDLELLNLLQNDAKLNATCSSLAQSVSGGIQFIGKRNEFWRQQGANEKRSAPKRSQLAISRPLKVAKSSLDQVPLELTRARILMQNLQFPQAISALSDVARFVLEFASEAASKMLSDVYVMLGCCYYELSEYATALDHFVISLEKSEAVNDVFGRVRALRCCGRAGQSAGDAEQAISYYQKAALLAGPETAFLAQLCAFNLSYAQFEAHRSDQARMSLRNVVQAMQNGEGAFLAENDPSAYLLAAPVFFRDADPLPEQLFQDSLCLAGLLDLDGKGEQYLQQLVEFSGKIRDVSGKRAGLQNLAHLYKEQGREEQLKEVMEELECLDSLSAV